MTDHRARVSIQGIFHALIAVLAWFLFFYWWNEVIPQTNVDDAAMAFLVIFLTVLLSSVLTLLWVRYNIGIFRRKGPRKILPAVSEERDADPLGRTLDHPGTETLKSAPVVVVSHEGERKKFALPRSA